MNLNYKKRIYNIINSPKFQACLPPILSQTQTNKFIKNKKIVWHTCTPKSASSSWNSFNIKVMQVKKINAKFFTSISTFGNVPHIPDSNYIVKQLSLSFNRINFSNHQHSIATDDFLQILSNNHIIICQTRPILDTIVSIINFMDEGGSKNWFSPLTHLYWDKLSHLEKIDHIVRTYLPWHVHYLQTWIAASEYYDINFIYYDDVVNNTRECFNKVYSKWNLSISNEEIIENNLILPKRKFSKGVSGTGSKLISKKTIDRIGSIVEDMDKLNQSLVNFLT
jgi:hypothetical protein